MSNRAAIREYRWPTVAGFIGVEPSGASEKTNASGRNVVASEAARSTALSRCSTRTATVSGSNVIRRRRWVLVSFLDEYTVVPGDRAPDGDRPGLEVHMGPPDAAELAATKPRRHGEPHQGAPVRIRPGLLEKPCRLLGGGRLWVGRKPRWRGHKLCRVDRDPLPTDRPVERSVQEEVDLLDGRRCERNAGVGTAALVAGMRPRRPVIDPAPAGFAVDLAPPELRVQRLEVLGSDSSGLDPAELFSHVLLHVLGVRRLGGGRDVDQLEVTREKLIDGRGGSRLPVLVGLVGEPPHHLVRFGGRFRAGGNSLFEIVLPAADRIDTRVHADPERPAAEFLDAPPLPSAGSLRVGHETSLRPTDATKDAMSCGDAEVEKLSPQLRGGGYNDFRGSDDSGCKPSALPLSYAPRVPRVTPGGATATAPRWPSSRPPGRGPRRAG